LQLLARLFHLSVATAAGSILWAAGWKLTGAFHYCWWVGQWPVAGHFTIAGGLAGGGWLVVGLPDLFWNPCPGLLVISYLIHLRASFWYQIFSRMTPLHARKTWEISRQKSVELWINVGMICIHRTEAEQ